MRYLWMLVDYFCSLLHLAVIGFLLIAWAVPELRLMHLYLCLIVFASWVGLGYFYEFGHCFLTDYQWKVKEKYLGEKPATDSFIFYFLQKIGIKISEKAAILNTYVIGLVVFVLSLVLNADYIYTY